MIPYQQRSRDAGALLAPLFESMDRGDRPRLIDGDCHGVDITRLGHVGLAVALDTPLTRAAAHLRDQSVWLCTVQSSADLPAPTDDEWSRFSRKILAATGIAPEGDPDACRWIALSDQPRQVRIVATLVREDGRPIAQGNAMPYAVWAECRRIGSEYAARYRVGQVTVPVPYESAHRSVSGRDVAIAREPSGSVVARGGDSLAASLLDHAGFSYSNDWHGPRHRLPTTMPLAQQAVIASHATEILRAARYRVDLDPVLDSTRLVTPSDPLGSFHAGAEILHLIDRIRAAESAPALVRALDNLLHPEHGAVERVREALEAAAEQVTEFDGQVPGLSDRLDRAAELLASAQTELAAYDEDLRRVGTHSPKGVDTWSAARATSPAVTHVGDALGTTLPGRPGTAPHRPSGDTAPGRTR